MHHHITRDIYASLVEARSRVQVPGVKYEAFTVKQPDMEATEERAPPPITPLSPHHTQLFLGLSLKSPPAPLRSPWRVRPLPSF